MSGGLSRVSLRGPLASDPELKYTGSGKARTRFRLAVGHRFKDSTGQIQEATTFVTITVWGPQAESCAQYLSKGRSALVEGRLRISSYSDDESKETKWFTEVVASNVQFVGGPMRTSDEPGTVSAPTPAPSDESQPSEEEVPF